MTDEGFIPYGRPGRPLTKSIIIPPRPEQTLAFPAIILTLGEP